MRSFGADNRVGSSKASQRCRRNGNEDKEFGPTNVLRSRRQFKMSLSNCWRMRAILDFSGELMFAFILRTLRISLSGGLFRVHPFAATRA
jgi:hypothetical protein